MPTKNIVHVAVAVIQNNSGEYLIAKRPQETHQGGLWEFPGGKVENNESVLDALKREVLEEVGLTFKETEPIIQIHHNYADKAVFLDVFRVKGITGDAFGKEGQNVCWISEGEFSLYQFPAANLPIIKALQLPDKYMITGEFTDETDLLTRIDAALTSGIRLIQFRAHHLSESMYFDFAKKIHRVCESYHAKLILNTSLSKYRKNQAHTYSHGLHFTSKEIKQYNPDEFKPEGLISTSIHNKKEAMVAGEKSVDFAVLSPVNITISHPESIPLGWDKFEQLTKEAFIPVYALGGMNITDLSIAKKNGAQGIAAIAAFWNKI